MSKDYAAKMAELQVQIVRTQAWAIEKGLKTVIVFEGRDTAGKDGAIRRLTRNMAPRNTRVVALPKPSERESSQWYFQRYVSHLPAAGETVIFNRSWYNRAGVEPVMGFCSPAQYDDFLNEVDDFERMLTHSGILLVKLWLDISRKEQAQRMKDRLEDPVKHFKISSLDKQALQLWDAYTKARDRMLSETDYSYAPWTIIKTDKKKQARLNIIRYLLHTWDCPDAQVERPDKEIVLFANDPKIKLYP